MRAGGLSSLTPARDCCILRTGGMARCYRVCIEAAREAMREGRPFDLETADWVASTALVALATLVAVHRARRSLEMRYSLVWFA